MNHALPPLLRIPINHHDPYMVGLRTQLIGQLTEKIREVLDTDPMIVSDMQHAHIRTIMVGGSAALDTPRHPQDIDLYLDADFAPEKSSERLQLIRKIVARATEKLDAKVDHVYVRDEESKAAGLQKIGVQAVFAPDAIPSQSSMAAARHTIHMPCKIEVHHECEKLFLPPVDAKGAPPDSRLKTIDARMIILQKLNRLFHPDDTLKGTDILDIAYYLDAGKFDPADPLMRKLGIATMASEGMLRNPVTMDFLVPRPRDEEITMLRQDLEFNISRELVTRYSDDDLGTMIDKVRAAVRTLYLVRVNNEALATPIRFEDAVHVSPGEQRFIDGIYQGKALGAGSRKALIQTMALFDGMDLPEESVLQRIQQDAGLLAEVAETNQQLREAGKCRSA